MEVCGTHTVAIARSGIRPFPALFPFSRFRTAPVPRPRRPPPVLWYALYSIIYLDSPASERISSTRSSKGSPSNFAALGRRLVSVIPGIVFASRKKTFPAGSTR